MSNKIILAFIAILLISIYFINNHSTTNNENLQLDSQNSQESINFLLIGDYGTGLLGQKETAKYLNEVAGEVNADFVIGTGDNFYLPNGVTGLDDPAWDSKWANVYQNKSNLKDLTWYGTIGNHDYGGKGLFSEFEYNKKGWRIDDFFWAHTTTVANKRVVFIHVDTSFLAYGIEGQSSKPQMKEYFKELNWTNNQQMLDQAEELLLQYVDYDWKFVVGHHQIGYSCKEVGDTNLFYNLFQKYKVDAYLSGHAHQLSYTQYENMGFILSGAGGYAGNDDNCYEQDPMWAKQAVFGFMSLELTNNQLNVKSYYTGQFKVDWQSREMVPLHKRQN